MGFSLLHESKSLGKAIYHQFAFLELGEYTLKIFWKIRSFFECCAGCSLSCTNHIERNSLELVVRGLNYVKHEHVFIGKVWAVLLVTMEQRASKLYRVRTHPFKNDKIKWLLEHFKEVLAVLHVLLTAVAKLRFQWENLYALLQA